VDLYKFSRESETKEVTKTFLLDLIKANPYREHLDLNFDDKIFFHETVNKYYDLPKVKKLVYQILCMIMNIYHKDGNSNL
jgi:hypothetical protein